MRKFVLLNNFRVRQWPCFGRSERRLRPETVGDGRATTELLLANKRRICYIVRVDEGRKRVLLIAANILAARKLSQFDGGKRVPATLSAISDAARWADEIMKAMDERWPAGS